MGRKGGRTACVLGLLGLMLLAGLAAPTRAAGTGVQPDLPNQVGAMTSIVEQVDRRLGQVLTGSGVQPELPDALRAMRTAAAGIVARVTQALGDGVVCGDGTVPPPGEDTGTIEIGTGDAPGTPLVKRIGAGTLVLGQVDSRLARVLTGSGVTPELADALRHLGSQANIIVVRITIFLGDSFPCTPTDG